MTDDAFTAFYRESRLGLYGTIQRWLHNHADTEEVLNDAFRVFHRALPKFRGECSLRSFLYRIAVNLAHNRHDRNQRRRYYANASLDAVLDCGTTIAEFVAAPCADPILFQEIERSVRDGLQLLAPADRDIIKLTADAELSYEELAVAAANSNGDSKIAAGSGAREAKESDGGGGVSVTDTSTQELRVPHLERNGKAALCLSARVS